MSASAKTGRALALLVLLVGVPTILFGQGPPPAPAVRDSAEVQAPASYPDPKVAGRLALAVLQLDSHGCSGTVIATGDGWSDILSCAHAFRGPDARKPIHMVGYAAPPGATGGLAASRLLDVDYRLDLAIIRLAKGPLHVCPVADAGWQPGGGRCLLSAGYDRMEWPETLRWARYRATAQDGKYITAEVPWHGRSGGALIAQDAGRLVGVVHGYFGDRFPDWYGSEHVPEATKQAWAEAHCQGLYVSLPQIQQFLSRQRPVSSPAAPRPPPAAPQRRAGAPRYALPPVGFAPQFAPQTCPGGA